MAKRVSPLTDEELADIVAKLSNYLTTGAGINFAHLKTSDVLKDIYEVCRSNFSVELTPGEVISVLNGILSLQTVEFELIIDELGLFFRGTSIQKTG